jgi:hypothetical protein
VLGATLELAAVSCRCPLRDIYLDVVFGPEGKDDDPPPLESASR